MQSFNLQRIHHLSICQTDQALITLTRFDCTTSQILYIMLAIVFYAFTHFSLSEDSSYLDIYPNKNLMGILVLLTFFQAWPL
jgi:hypothetical protein